MAGMLNISHLDEVLTVLQKYLFDKTKYYELGLKLGLLATTLDTIRTESVSNVAACLLECLKKWLSQADNVESKGVPSYYTLIAALRSMGEKAVADGIDREMHPACVILGNYESDESLQDSLPSLVILLHKERITKERFAIGGAGVILTAVKEAVCFKHENLEKFATILQLFPATISVGGAILKDYRNLFNEATNDEESKSLKIPIPRSLNHKFGAMRAKFADMLLEVHKTMTAPLKDLKNYYQFGYPYLKPQLANCQTQEDVLQVISENCSLINISSLEGVVDKLNVENAKFAIQQYKESVEKFCKEILPLLNEKFSSPSPLQCESVTFLVNKRVDDCTLADIDDLINAAFEQLSLHVRVVVIREGNSFTITCSFPLILSESLIASALKNLQSLIQKGLLQLTIGYSTVYSTTHDEVKKVGQDEKTCLKESAVLEQEWVTAVYTSRGTLEQLIVSQTVKLVNREYELQEELNEKLTEQLARKSETDKEMMIYQTKLKKEILSLQEKQRDMKDQLVIMEQEHREELTSLSEKMLTERLEEKSESEKEVMRLQEEIELLTEQLALFISEKDTDTKCDTDSDTDTLRQSVQEKEIEHLKLLLAEKEKKIERLQSSIEEIEDDKFQDGEEPDHDQQEENIPTKKRGHPRDEDNPLVMPNPRKPRYSDDEPTTTKHRRRKRGHPTSSDDMPFSKMTALSTSQDKPKIYLGQDADILRQSLKEKEKEIEHLKLSIVEQKEKLQSLYMKTKAVPTTGMLQLDLRVPTAGTARPLATSTTHHHPAAATAPPAVMDQHQIAAGNNYKLISLTSTADGSTSVHKSVPLFYPNNVRYDVTTNKLIPNGEKRHSLRICPVGMELLANIHKPIAVLSIAGPARTGKSYILSRLLDSHDAFELGHLIRAQTHGIWIGTQALEYDDRVLVLLDTEGIGAVSIDGSNDAKILMMTLLMSSYFIYNSLGMPRTDDLNRMRVFTTLAQSVTITSQQQHLLRHHFPNFLWLLRDFILELEDETGKQTTPREFLLKEVLRPDDRLSMLSEYDKVRTAILSTFPNFDCFVLPPPSTRRKVMSDIAARHEELGNEFKFGVEKLISHLRSSVTAKKVFQSNKPINGRTLSLLAYNYIKSLNTPGAVLCLDDIWAAVAKQRRSEIQDELVEEYRVQMEQKIAELSKGRLPLEFEATTLEDTSSLATPTSIMGIHRFVYSQLEKKLLSRIGQFISATNDEFVEEQHRVVRKFEWEFVQYEREIIVGGVLSSFLQSNNELSKRYCTKLWQKQYESIKAQIQSGDRSYTYQQYTEEFDKAHSTYLSLARGPAKWTVLEEAEKSLELERHHKQLQGYDEEFNKMKVETWKLNEEARIAEEKLYEDQGQRNEEAKKMMETVVNIREETKQQIEVRQAELEERLCQEMAKQADIMAAHMTELANVTQKSFDSLRREKEESERKDGEMMQAMMSMEHEMREKYAEQLEELMEQKRNADREKENIRKELDVLSKKMETATQGPNLREVFQMATQTAAKERAYFELERERNMRRNSQLKEIFGQAWLYRKIT